MGPIQLLFNGYWGSFPGVKRPGCEVGHSHPSNGEVKSEWNCTSAPHNVLMTWTGVALALLFTWEDSTVSHFKQVLQKYASSLS